ncbi:MAG TPA: D-alanyl-D-alanine carboxypeptidase [Ruminococcaceae bacterium]|nr:D-alanyl-D-alanine carboxypeptidase [Oscillospiraceae bacterium]
MFRIKTTCLAGIMLFVCLILPFKTTALSAHSYALLDQQSGRLIASSNPQEKMPMASTTKIMTGLLACESGRLDEIVSVPPEALTVEGSSMGLLPDEKITLRALVYGLMLNSGNDAANSIAMILGGSIPGFAAQMNIKAQKLQLHNTHFENPSGLGADGHYTTALDLAKLGANAMNNADFSRIVSTKRIKVSYNGIQNGRTLVNHNHLLGTYTGEIGIKTGFTKKSGRCLVSCATRNGVTLVLVTLNDPDDWRDHSALLDQGFAQLHAVSLLDKPIERNVSVAGGTKNSIGAQCEQVDAALQSGEEHQVTMQVNLPKQVAAPVRKGQKIGEVVFTIKGTPVARGALLATSSVGKAPGKPHSFFYAIRSFFTGLFKSK